MDPKCISKCSSWKSKYLKSFLPIADHWKAGTVTFQWFIMEYNGYPNALPTAHQWKVRVGSRLADDPVPDCSHNYYLNALAYFHLIMWIVDNWFTWIYLSTQPPLSSASSSSWAAFRPVSSADTRGEPRADPPEKYVPVVKIYGMGALRS